MIKNFNDFINESEVKDEEIEKFIKDERKKSPVKAYPSTSSVMKKFKINKDRANRCFAHVARIISDFG